MRHLAPHRLRSVRRTAQFSVALVGAMLAALAPRLGAQIGPVPMGLAPALLELPSGEVTTIPGPYREIDGQLYVTRTHRQLFIARIPSQDDAARNSRRPSLPRIGSATLDVLVTNPNAGPGNTQNDPVAIVHGDTVVVGFTDSEGLFIPGRSSSGFATSLDGGATWVDVGSLPLAGLGGSEMLLGEPSLVTDRAGRWYYISLYDVGNGGLGPGSGDLGLAISTGSWSGGQLLWGPPWLFAGGRTSGSDLEHHDVVVDAENDRLYVTYTNFSLPLAGWGQVEVVTLGDHATSVLQSTIVQPEVSMTNNGGSRLALGPNGELYCAWGSGLLGGQGQGPGSQLVARSVNAGLSFAPPVVAGTIIESWFSDPPGSTREDFNPEFPALAVQHTPGPNHGRVYVVWQDAVGMVFNSAAQTFDEPAAPNDTPQTAAQLPNTTSDWLVNGSLPSGDARDFYRFHASAGEHFRAIAVASSGLLGLRLRLRCTDTNGNADTLLAQSARGILQFAWALVTLPATGDYIVEIERTDYTGSYNAWLRKTTQTMPSTAIDYRDIVLVSSPDGIGNWSAKVRVNDDTGPSDQAFPDVAIDATGVHVLWYDRRFDLRCHARADAVLATSTDGGSTFVPNLRLSAVSSSWQVNADVAPNFGESVRMAAAAGRVYAPWTDGRLGTPDVRISVLPSGFELEAPDSLFAKVGTRLGAVIDVANGLVAGDTIHIQVSSVCEASLPLASYDLGNLAALERRSVVYDPPVPPGFSAAAPCTLRVEARSARTGRTLVEEMVITTDGPVAVELSDFVATYASDRVQLEWSAAPMARFDVERGAELEGPYLCRTPAPLVTSNGRFEFTDRDVGGNSICFYRLVAYQDDRTTRRYGPYRIETRTLLRVVFGGAQPNPINPEPHLEFELPRSATVTLRIIDVRGRDVVTLLRQVERQAGIHVVPWNGCDAHGKRLASGVYIAELVAGGERYTQRLVVAR